MSLPPPLRSGCPFPHPTRNHLLAVLSRVFNLCETWDWRPQHTNPVRGVEAVEEPRDRTLNSR